MSFLLDTNVISELRKPSADPGVRSWFDEVDGSELYLSVLVVGEIRQGIERLSGKDPKQAQLFEAWLDRLRLSYAERILIVDIEVAEEWGRLNAAGALPATDGLLAATAKVHDLTLVTRNVGDVRRSGVRLLDPFTG